MGGGSKWQKVEKPREGEEMKTVCKASWQRKESHICRRSNLRSCQGMGSMSVFAGGSGTEAEITRMARAEGQEEFQGCGQGQDHTWDTLERRDEIRIGWTRKLSRPVPGGFHFLIKMD